MKPLYCILGASGSGKSTICSMLQLFGYEQIPSYTTRSPRYEGEKGHTFVTDEEFDNLKNVIAYAETTGHKYCVTKEQLENEDYDLYVVDFSGLKYLKKCYDGERRIVSIFIDCDEVFRAERLYDRYSKPELHTNEITSRENVYSRLSHDRVEFKDAKESCDWIVRNNYRDDINTAVGMIRTIIDEETNRMNPNDVNKQTDVGEGNIQIDIEKRVSEIIDKYWHEIGGYYSGYRYDENDVEYEMKNELDKYLGALNVSYSIDCEAGYRSCAYDNDFLAVAWSYDGVVHMRTVLIEYM